MGKLSAKLKQDMFTKKDLDVKCKKVVYAKDLKGNASGYIFFELKEIPLKNSVKVACGFSALTNFGPILPNFLQLDDNIVALNISKVFNFVLIYDNDYCGVTYLPDTFSKKPLWHVQNSSCISDAKGISCNWKKENGPGH